jgi:hypothetical protein
MIEYNRIGHGLPGIVLSGGTIKTAGIAGAIDEEAGPPPLSTQGASLRDMAGIEFGPRMGPMRLGIAHDTIQQRRSGENGFLYFIWKQPFHRIINVCIRFVDVRIKLVAVNCCQFRSKRSSSSSPRSNSFWMRSSLLLSEKFLSSGIQSSQSGRPSNPQTEQVLVKGLNNVPQMWQIP